MSRSTSGRAGAAAEWVEPSIPRSSRILRLQGFYNALAGITLPNPGSEGLHRSMGFEPVGVYRNIGYKCGGWHDVAWSQLTLREPEREPRLPLALDAVRGSSAWEDAIRQGVSILETRWPSSSAS